MAAAGPIVVYGATGYTGTLVAHELRRRGLPMVLSGRSAEKLATLAAALGGDDVATRAVALDDAAGLRALLADSPVVIDCAGPFVHYGEPIVRAAIDSATHYVDTTGEQPYIRDVRARFDGAARAAGVALVPAMGFDYVPGDLIAHLVARGREPLRELVLAYATQDVQPTRGTTRTALGMVAEGGVLYEDGDWRRAPLRAGRARFTFPDPIGSQPMLRYPSGEIVTVPHHVRTRAITALMTVATVAGTKAAAPLLPVALPALTLALRSPLAAGLETLLARMPEGPAPERRAAARWTIVALAHGEDGRTRRAIVRGRDPYGLTAIATVHGAALMCEPAYDRSGVHSVATAYHPQAFLDALAPHGVSYELDA